MGRIDDKRTGGSMWENFILAGAGSSGGESASIWDSIIKQAPGLITQWGPKIALALLLLFVFWLASRMVRKVIFAAGEKGEVDDHVVRLMAMTARVGLLIAGLITALGTMGVDVSALVAGLGLTGFALGFAVKDTISNAFKFINYSNFIFYITSIKFSAKTILKKNSIQKWKC